ncbi:GNAT family N-acetyltransferase [Pedobacter sp. UYP30]|uniref:GNAT family N-acetyltransferase n=1 Tax=Pedobacter sp. UYP30 TaxID=1756400 RepID=UPI003393BF92
MILRKASFSEQPIIWEILQQAIEQRKQDGSTQWQNGYPNEQTVNNDIANGAAFVLIDQGQIIAYAAILNGIEPNYAEIEGAWLSNDDYLTVHRVAVSNKFKGKGTATQLFNLIEEICIKQKTYSIRVDTNFDNVPMLRILEKLGYTYCGEILADGAPRKAFEKRIGKLTAS